MTRLPFAILLCGLAFTAGAQNAGQDLGAGAAADASQTEPSRTENRFFATDGQRTGDRQSLSDRNCLRQTGSRIVARENARTAELRDPVRKGRCVPAHGRSYDRDDLDRTGEMDVADALRRLDPSIN